MDSRQPVANGHATLRNDSGSLESEGVTIDTGDAVAIKRDAAVAGLENEAADKRDKRRKGIAPIKEEFLIKHDTVDAVEPRTSKDAADDDAAEAFHHQDRMSSGNTSKGKHKEKSQGQNKARRFGSSRDEVGLCSSRALVSELSPPDCRFGDRCKFEHDLRVYLKFKREDLSTFGSVCPVFEVKGRCNSGWKCRFVGSHSKEIEHADGKKELVLMEDSEKMANYSTNAGDDEDQPGVVNIISTENKYQLTRRKYPTPKSDAYVPWLEKQAQNPEDQGRRQTQERLKQASNGAGLRNSSSPEPESANATQDNRAMFSDPPLLASEKRRLYFGPDTPTLAPLTTQGNLPYRRLCTSLGAAFTYSEMAMALPLLQGQKSEWALLKAHESEIQPPTLTMSKAIQNKSNIVYDYDRSQDITLGAQIAASKPWQAIKATEVITTLLPQGLRVVDLNCGCPIDLVYREGAGSGLMDAPNKLEKILRGMNAVSGATPVTVKIRMGTKDKTPTAHKLVKRLILGGETTRGNPCGVAAITLHGRSRQQRYTRSADWDYINSTAKLIKDLNSEIDEVTDTIHEPEERDQPNPHKGSSRKNKVFFLGNGDVYSHEHYNTHIEQAGVDTCMVARGALVKPWLFEEIATNQYLDKSATERLQYIEKFCRYGLEAWGSDEVGVGQTRRFLLEWLSFACRYVPIGLLEVLPPNLQDRPPRYHGRNELESLMASENYLDWIKLSEMFLGPAHKDFRFEPKHKSNSYEAEG